MKFERHSLVVVITKLSLLFVLLVSAGWTLTIGKAAKKSAPLQMSSTAGTINYGETVSGSISSSGEIDTFTFVGNQGDRILIGISETSGELWPMIELYDPNNNLLISDTNPIHTDLIMSLPATGTYSILVSDGFDGTFTGGYNLYLQRLNNPVNADSITFGEITGGSIAKEAEMDAFTFSAADGDTIIIGASETSGDIWPEIRLYDSTGNLLQSDYDPAHAEIIIKFPAMNYIFLPIVMKPLTNANTHPDLEFENSASPEQIVRRYTILISDGFNGTSKGGYNLHLQRLNNPSSEVPISFNEIKSGTISLAAEMDLLTFEANKNDTIIIASSITSGDIWPEVRLFDPQINLLHSESDTTYAEMTVTLPASGTYTILINDSFSGALTGDYNLFLQRLNNANGAVPLSFGEVKSGFITLAAEMDLFTFEAEENDTIIIGKSVTSGDVWPEIRLYDPQINLLHSEGDTTHAEMTVNLPSSGTYTILVRDGFDGILTGGYNLFLQRLNNPSGAVPISFGETKSGDIALAAEMDLFTFVANENDTVTISISYISGSIWPEIRLYDPNINLLQTESDAFFAEMIITLPASGTYSILVSDGFDWVLTGEYEVSLQ